MKMYAWLIALLFAANTTFAETTPLDASIEKLQHDWATANYKAPEKDKEAAFKKLSEEARQVSVGNPGRAEALIWEAIILSGYAKVKGMFGDASVAEKARDLLFDAEKIDPKALHGSVYTTLGSLHYKVPGWPISFGDKKKAREYLEKSLQINPDGIDPNFFYGEFMMEQENYAKAVEHLKKALAAPPRPGREDADEGRKEEIQQALKKAEQRR